MLKIPKSTQKPEIEEFELNFGVCATFSTISAISWRPVLVVEEAGLLG
jgi:hypothetical protein